LSSNGAPVTIHIIAGPTASGKSAFALELAQQKSGVIINCDSMQIFDALHVLAAQPSANDLEAAPHRLYSTLKPGEKCSAGIWQQMAAKEIEAAIQNGQTPIICGGNGLYIRALMEGLSPIPETPDDIRDKAVKRQEELGNPAFHEELKKIDPESAARFHPHHTARLVRAFEVYLATGKKLSDWQKEMKNAPPENWRFELHKIIPERDVLYQRCDERFIKMLDEGALEEVKDLADKIDSGLVPEGALITKAHGFQYLRQFLNGKLSREKAIELSQNETRQYAKRQVTWFKNQL
jgi:tRNA dimethylallyltransferase